jgi:hypothetical protein
MNTIELPKSELAKKQTQMYQAHVDGEVIRAHVRHDDSCGNGHNTFAITGEVYTMMKRPGEKAIREDGRWYWLDSCGCIHDTIAKHFPNLVPLLKWHLTSTDEPMHYIANTIYHAQNNDFDAARHSAVWPEATDEQLKDPFLAGALEARLPALMEEFKTAVESLGLVY